MGHFSESEVRAALRELSATRILAELTQYPPTEDNITHFLDLLQRSNDVLFKYPDATRERSRDDLLSSIEAYIVTHFSTEIQNRLQEIAKVIRRVETGYRNLLNILNKTPVRKRSPSAQPSAAL